jgi:predicted site-specific integrase-resolvase
LYRGNDYFKKYYQPRTNTAKDQKGDLVTDTPSILVRWRKHFSQLLHIHGVNDVRRTEIHTAGPLVPEPSAFGFELVIENIVTDNQLLIKS